MSESTTCSDCGQTLDGLEELPSGARSPCRNCGSTRRAINVSIEERLVVSDHFALLGRREGKVFTFGESRRSDGRAASANRKGDGSFSYSVFGSSPQGEEQSLSACRLLVDKLNSQGASWGEPSLVEMADVDCQAVDANVHGVVLQIQVVQAIADSRFWKSLNTQGSAEASAKSSTALAQRIAAAIRHKEAKIPPNARSDLTLLLDATLVPVLAFDDVIEGFRSKYGDWADSLGFEAIWLVGPLDDLVQQLDDPI